jgi:hypothetical protein
MAFNQIAHTISQDYIKTIIALDHDPILRNLKITQCYFDLSQNIAARIGNENVNWCTFATWASKTAGRFIRLENINVHLHDAIYNSNEYQDWLLLIKDKYEELDIEHQFEHHQLHKAAHNSIALISADIAAGNLKVFSELGPAFSEMIDAFDQSLAGNRNAIDIVLQKLRTGDTAEGGQELLANAIRDFHAALHESDRDIKAELVLRANAQTGMHEQIRLQPYIAAAMEAPLPETFTNSLKHHATKDAPGHTHFRIHGILDMLMSPIAKRVHDTWLNLSTHYLMTLELPDGILYLGHDLPKPEGANLFPDHLVNPQDPDLNNLLLLYNNQINRAHSKARNWAVFEDRMHYILNLFRSRQCHSPLHESPFEMHQTTYLRENKIPAGKL